MTVDPYDRRVHVTIVPPAGGLIEIARYDRAGAWYYESGDERRRITLTEAVSFVTDRPSVIWHEGLLGGKLFDARVRRMRAAAKR